MESAIVYLKLRMKKFLKFVVVLPISIGPVWKSIEGFVVVPHLCAWMKYLTELGNTTRSSTSPQCNRPQMGVLPITAIQKNQYKKYDKNWVIVFSQRFYLIQINAHFQIYFYKKFITESLSCRMWRSAKQCCHDNIKASKSSNDVGVARFLCCLEKNWSLM